MELLGVQLTWYVQLASCKNLGTDSHDRNAVPSSYAGSLHLNLSLEGLACRPYLKQPKAAGFVGPRGMSGWCVLIAGFR